VSEHHLHITVLQWSVFGPLFCFWRGYSSPSPPVSLPLNANEREGDNCELSLYRIQNFRNETVHVNITYESNLILLQLINVRILDNKSYSLRSPHSAPALQPHSASHIPHSVPRTPAPAFSTKMLVLRQCHISHVAFALPNILILTSIEYACKLSTGLQSCEYHIIVYTTIHASNFMKRLWS
jgi:hypothetical protein